MPHQTAANVEEIFLAALEIEGLEARSSYLDKVCGDAEARRHVERLLALDARASGFLASPHRRRRSRLNRRGSRRARAPSSAPTS